MLYTWSFFIALAVFLIGIIYRIIGYFRLNIGPDRVEFTTADRIKAFLSSLFGILVSPVQMFNLFKTVILNVVFQVPLMRQDPLKWFMHICIYWGFFGLLFFHALEGYVSEVIFSDYQSTLTPFLALRNMAGVMVMAGVGMSRSPEYCILPPRKAAPCSDTKTTTMRRPDFSARSKNRSS